MTNPKAFLSYSWEDDLHKTWVAELATQLRGDGVETVLDQWHAVPGDQLPAFMEREIRQNDHVLIICTPTYRTKSDGRKGGVGYEGDIMTAEVHTQQDHRKFIPILARGEWAESAPSWLKGKYYIDMSLPNRRDNGYADLVATLLGIRPAAPPVRKRVEQLCSNQTDRHLNILNEPVRIIGIIVDEVTEPSMDGSPGSALYTVPFRLSRNPSPLWKKVFVRTWNSPPRYSTMHRPGIARVNGNKIILNGTTIEEVRDVHRNTLALCIERANKHEMSVIADRKIAEEAKRQQSERHRESIAKIAGDIDFD